MAKEISDSLTNFTITEFLGAGAYGSVFAAKEISSGTVVAIKSCKHVLSSRTLAKRTLRELRLLRYCFHPNIITLQSILPPSDHESLSELNFVFELMDTDLAQVIRSNQKLVLEHIQFFGMQLLSALEFLHHGHVIHRDVKPRNILVNADCTLKLADFGLSKVFYDGSTKGCGPDANITDYVTTRWYRAPEVLSGWSIYGSAIDMWAVGCILAELFLRIPLFPGGDSVKQLDLITTTLGIPDTSFLRMCKKSSRKQYVRLMDIAPTKSMLRTRLQRVGSDGYDLISRLLVFDPIQRPSATECLKHPFFTAAEYQPEPFDNQYGLHVPREAFLHEDGESCTIERLRLELLNEVAIYMPTDSTFPISEDDMGSSASFSEIEHSIIDIAPPLQVPIAKDDNVTLTETDAPITEHDRRRLSTKSFESESTIAQLPSFSVCTDEEELLNQPGLEMKPDSPRGPLDATLDKPHSGEAVSSIDFSQDPVHVKSTQLSHYHRRRKNHHHNLSRDTVIESFVPPKEEEILPPPSVAKATTTALSPVAAKLRQLKSNKETKANPTYQHLSGSSASFSTSHDRSLDYEPKTLKTISFRESANDLINKSNNMSSRATSSGITDSALCSSSLSFSFCASQEKSPLVSKTIEVPSSTTTTTKKSSSLKGFKSSSSCIIS